MIKKTKQKFSSLILAGVIALAALVFPTGTLLSSFANAATQETVTLSNSNFNNNKDASYLDTNPTGWSKLENTLGTYGIINTAESKFNKSNYKLLQNPQTLTADSNDTKILMLNARRSEESELANDRNEASQGYESNSLSLASNSYYQVSILAKSEIGAFGSIYLKGLTANTANSADDLTQLTKFEKIQTSGNWSEYIFFIETGQEAQTATLQLWLGEDSGSNARSPYAVFYDNIKVVRYAQTAFEKQLQNYTSSPNINFISLNKHLISSVQNANFEIADITAKDTSENRYWTPVSYFPYNSVQRIVDATKPLTARHSDNSVKTYNFLNSNNLIGDNALWLAANNVSGEEFGYKSTTLQIDKFGYYKVNVTAKVDADTTAKIILQENDDISEFLISAGLSEDDFVYTPKSETFTITSNPTDNALMNNYGTYTFYIKASALYSTSLHIQLLLAPSSDQSTTFSGSVLFDDITVEQISNIAYSSATSSTYVKKLDLEVTSNAGLSVANGTFNLANVDRDDISFPLSPQNWTVEQEDNLKAKAGIINLQTNHFNDNKAGYGTNVNPGNPSGVSTDLQTNNVLMLWNSQETFQKVISDQVSVTSNTIYTLTFKFKTTQPGSNFNISVLNQDNINIYKTSKVSSIASDNYSSTNMWLTFKINVRTGSSTTGLKLVFGLGDENLASTGHVFIDNVAISTSTMTETTLLEKLATQSLFEKTIDMSNLLLNAPYKDENGKLIITAFNQSVLDGYAQNGATAGVVNGTANEKEIANAEDNDTNNKYIYYIETLGRSNYQLSSKEQLNLSANTIYKFSIWINTRIGTIEDENVNYGASFRLGEIADAKLENIKTGGEWEEFVIIVNTTTDSKVNLNLSLLSQNIQTDGMVFFENFKMTTLNQTQYQEYVADFKENSTNLVIVGSTDPVIEEDDDTETPNQQDFNYLVLPSMFTAIALVIAVAAGVLKRVNFKKFARKQKTEYDRKKTLYKDVIRKDAQVLRDKNIEEVNKEISKIDEQIATLEEANKERLQKSRKEKGRQIDSETEKQFKLYAKQRTKLERQKIVLVEKIKKYNTAEYLLVLQEEVTKKQLQNLK